MTAYIVFVLLLLVYVHVMDAGQKHVPQQSKYWRSYHLLCEKTRVFVYCRCAKCLGPKCNG